MASFNKVILLGNLTRDPEVRYTPKGTAVTDLGLAVNRTYTADNGEKREEVTFVDVTFWGRTAEMAGEYLKKGRPVFIEGRLQLDSWDDKQSGQKRTQAQSHRRKHADARLSAWRRRWRAETKKVQAAPVPADRRRPRRQLPPRLTTTRFLSDRPVGRDSVEPSTFSRS